MGRHILILGILGLESRCEGGCWLGDGDVGRRSMVQSDVQWWLRGRFCMEFCICRGVGDVVGYVLAWYGLGAGAEVW